jgi:hypothetical protein
VSPCFIKGEERMYKVISMKAEDGSYIDVPFLANAATPFRFKSIFGQDLIVLFQTFDANEAYDIDFVSQLAFVMAMQAQGKTGGVDMGTVNKESMLSWLEQFDSFSLYEKANEVLSVYLGNSKITSIEKKKARKQNVK